MWTSALDISNSKPQRASLVFLPQVMYHMRLFINESEWKSSKTHMHNMNCKQLKTQSSLCVCKCYKYSCIRHSINSSVFPAPVEILLWQNVLLNALILSPLVSAGDSGPCRLKGHWCKQSVRLRVQFQMLSALITGLWNPSGPLNHLPKPTVGCIIRL